MVPVNFNQLYYFWVIAKAGSISLGAKRLLLNQSTLSLQLKQLERALGVPLLNRSRRGVAPTRQGQQAFEHCERIFSEAEELVALLKGSEALARPAFRIGASQTVSWQRIAAVIRRLKTLAPESSIVTQTRSSEELQERLERRMLDLVISDLDLSVRLGKRFRSRLVLSAPLFFAAVPALKKKMGSFPSGLGRLPLLLRSASNPVRRDVEHFLHRNAITPRIQAEVENPDLIRILAVQGDGAALMDPEAAENDLRNGRLVKLHRAPIGIKENIWFISCPGRKNHAGTEAALDHLMEDFSFGAARA